MMRKGKKMGGSDSSKQAINCHRIPRVRGVPIFGIDLAERSLMSSFVFQRRLILNLNFPRPQREV